MKRIPLIPSSPWSLEIFTIRNNSLSQEMNHEHCNYSR